MSTATVIAVCAAPAAVLVVLLVAYLAYQAIAHDVARRLRAHANHLQTSNPLHTAPPGIRYAADLIERWSRR